MTDSTPVNLQAFAPYNGGVGARLALTTTTGRVAIPGLEGGSDPKGKRRVVVSNGGSVSAFVRVGNSSVVATTGSLEVMPGCYVTITPPHLGTSPVYLAGITESGTTKINGISGEGS